MEAGRRNYTVSWVLLIIIVLGGWYIYKYHPSFLLEKTVGSRPFDDYAQELGKEVISCEFNVISDFYYENKKDPFEAEGKKIYYGSESEDPITLTFAGLTTDKPVLKGNNGEAQLTVLKNDDVSIVLAEVNAFEEVFLYTIFKEDKVATWQKSLNLIKTPYAMQSMGYCR
jgi:hypothetical protein